MPREHFHLSLIKDTRCTFPNMPDPIQALMFSFLTCIRVVAAVAVGNAIL